MFANLSLILLLFGSRYRLPPSPPHIHPGRQCPRVIPYDTDLLEVAQSGNWYINRVTATSTRLRPYACMKAAFTIDPKSKNGLILEFQGLTSQEKVETSIIRIGPSEPGNEGIFEIDPLTRYLDLKATSIISHTKIGENEYIVLYACFYLPETHRYCDGAMILSRQPRLYLADLEVLKKDLNRRQEKPVFMRHIFHNALCDLLDQKVKELHLKSRNEAPLNEFDMSKSLAPLSHDDKKHEKLTARNNPYSQKKKVGTNPDLEAFNAHEKETNDVHLNSGKSDTVLQNKKAVGKKVDKSFKDEQTKLKMVQSASRHEDEEKPKTKDGDQRSSEPVITMNSRSLPQPQPAKCPYILSLTTPTPVLTEKTIEHPHYHDADGTSSEHKPEIAVKKPVVLMAKKALPGMGEPKREAKRKQNYPKNTRRDEPTRSWRTIKAATLKAPKHATTINKLQLPNRDNLKVSPAAFKDRGKQRPLKLASEDELERKKKEKDTSGEESPLRKYEKKSQFKSDNEEKPRRGNRRSQETVKKQLPIKEKLKNYPTNREDEDDTGDTAGFKQLKETRETLPSKEKRNSSPSRPGGDDELGDNADSEALKATREKLPSKKKRKSYPARPGGDDELVDNADSEALKATREKLPSKKKRKSYPARPGSDDELGDNADSESLKATREKLPSKKKRKSYPARPGSDDELGDNADSEALKATREKLPSKKKRKSYPARPGSDGELGDNADSEALKATREKLPSKKKRKSYPARPGGDDELVDNADSEALKATREKLPSKKKRKSYPARPGSDDELGDNADSESLKATREKLPSKKKRKSYPARPGSDDELGDNADSEALKATREKLPSKKKRKSYPARPGSDGELGDNADSESLKATREKLPSKKKRKSYPARPGGDEELGDNADSKALKATREKLPSKKKRKTYPARPGGDNADSEALKATKEKLPSKKKRKSYRSRPGGDDELGENADSEALKATREKLPSKKKRKSYPARPGGDDELGENAESEALKAIREKLPSKKKRKIYPARPGGDDELGDNADSEALKATREKLPSNKNQKSYPTRPGRDYKLWDNADAKPLKAKREKLSSKNNRKNYPTRPGRDDEFGDTANSKPLKATREKFPSKKKRKNYPSRPGDEDEIENIADLEPLKATKEKPTSKNKLQNYPTRRGNKPNFKRTKESRTQDTRETKDIIRKTRRPSKTHDLANKVKRKNKIRKGTLRIIKARSEKQRRIWTPDSINKPTIKKPTFRVVSHGTPEHKTFKLVQDDDLTRATKIKKPSFRIFGNNTSSKTPGNARREGRSNLVKKPAFRIMKNRPNIEKIQAPMRGQTAYVSSRFKNYPTLIKPQIKHVDSNVIQDKRPSKSVRSYSTALFGKFDNEPTTNELKQTNLKQRPIYDASMTNPAKRNAGNRRVDGRPITNAAKQRYAKPMTNAAKRGSKERTIDDTPLTDATKRGSRKRAFDHKLLTHATKRRSKKQTIDDILLTKATKRGSKKRTVEVTPMTNGTKQRKAKMRRVNARTITNATKQRNMKKPKIDGIPIPNEIKPELGPENTKTTKKYIQKDNIREYKKRTQNLPDISRPSSYPTENVVKEKKQKPLSNKLLSNARERRRHPVSFRSMDIFGHKKLSPEYNPKLQVHTENGRKRNAIVSGNPKLSIYPKKRNYKEKKKRISNELLTNAKKRRRSPAAFRSKNIFGDKKRLATSKKPVFRIFNDFPTKGGDISKKPGFRIFINDPKKQRSDAKKRTQKENFVKRDIKVSRAKDNNKSMKKPGFRNLKKVSNEQEPSGKKRKQKTNETPAARNRELTNFNLVKKPAFRMQNKYESRVPSDAKFSKLMPSYSENEVTPPKTKKRRHHHFAGFATHDTSGKKLIPRSTRKLELQQNPLLLNAKKRRRNPSAFKEKSIFTTNKTASPAVKYDTSKSKDNPFLMNAKKRRHNPRAFREKSIFITNKTASPAEKYGTSRSKDNPFLMNAKKRRRYPSAYEENSFFTPNEIASPAEIYGTSMSNYNPFFINAKKRRHNPSAFKEKSIFTTNKTSSPAVKYGTSKSKDNPFLMNAKKRRRYSSAFKENSFFTPNEIASPGEIYGTSTSKYKPFFINAKKRRHNPSAYKKKSIFTTDKTASPAENYGTSRSKENPLLINAKKRRHNPSAYKEKSIFIKNKKPSPPVKYDTSRSKYNPFLINAKKRRHNPSAFKEKSIFIKNKTANPPIKYDNSRSKSYNPLLINAKKRRHNPSAFKEKSIFIKNKTASPPVKYDTSRSKYNPLLINAKKRRHNPSAFKEKSIFIKNKTASPPVKYDTSRSKYNPFLINAKKRRHNPSAFKEKSIFIKNKTANPPIKYDNSRSKSYNPLLINAKKRRHNPSAFKEKSIFIKNKTASPPVKYDTSRSKYNPLLINAKKRRHNPSAFKEKSIFIKNKTASPPVKYDTSRSKYNPLLINAKKRRHNPSAFKEKSIFIKNKTASPPIKYDASRSKYNPLLINAKKRRHNPSAFRENSIFKNPKSKSQPEGRSFTFPTKNKGLKGNNLKPVQRPDHHEFIFTPAMVRLHPQPDESVSFGLNTNLTNLNNVRDGAHRNSLTPLKNRKKLYYFRITGGLDHRKQPQESKFGERKDPEISTTNAVDVQEHKPAVKKKHNDSTNGVFRKSPGRRTLPFKNNEALSKLNKQQSVPDTYYDDTILDHNKKPGFRIFDSFTDGQEYQRKKSRKSRTGKSRAPKNLSSEANPSTPRHKTKPNPSKRRMAHSKRKFNSPATNSPTLIFKKQPDLTILGKKSLARSSSPSNRMLKGYYYRTIGATNRTQSDDSGLNQNRNGYLAELNIGTQHKNRLNQPKPDINEIPTSPFVKTPTRQEYYQQGLVNPNNKIPMESSKNRKRKEKEQTDAKWKPNPSQRNDGKFPLLKHPHVKQEYYYRIQADPYDTKSQEWNKRPANIPVITAQFPERNAQQIRNFSDTLPFKRHSSVPYARQPFSFKKDTPSNTAIREMKSSFQLKQPTDNKHQTQTEIWGSKLPNTGGYITKPPTDKGMNFYKLLGPEKSKESPMKLANTASANKWRGQAGKYGNMISDPGEFFPKTPSRKAYFFKTYGVAKPTARQMNSVPTTSTPPFNHTWIQAAAKEKPQAEKKQMQPSFRGSLVPKLLPAPNHVRNYPQNRNMFTKPHLSSKQPGTSSELKQYYYRMEEPQYKKKLQKMRPLAKHSNRTSPTPERGFPTPPPQKKVSPFTSQQRQKMPKPIENKGNSLFGKKPLQLSSRPNEGKGYYFRHHELEPLKTILMKQASVKGHQTPLSMLKPFPPQRKTRNNMPKSNVVRSQKSEHKKKKQYYYRLTGGPTPGQAKSGWSPNTSGWTSFNTPNTERETKLNFPHELRAPNAAKQPNESFFYKLTPNNDETRPKNDDMDFQGFHKLEMPLKSLTTEAPSKILFYRPYGVQVTDIFGLPEQMRSEFSEVNNMPLNFHSPHKKSSIFRKSVEETKPENKSKTASSNSNLLPSPPNLSKEPGGHIIHSDCCSHVTIFPFPIINISPNKPTENPFLRNVRKRSQFVTTTEPEARQATTTEATRKPYMYTAYELFQRKKKELYLKKQREAKSTPARKKTHTDRKKTKVTPRRHFRKKKHESSQHSEISKSGNSPRNSYFYRVFSTPQLSSKQGTALEHPLLDNQGDQDTPPSSKKTKKNIPSKKLYHNSIPPKPKTRNSKQMPNTELNIQVQQKGTSVQKFPRKKVVLGNTYYYRVAETHKPRYETNKTSTTKPKKSSNSKRPVGSFYYKVVTSPPDANYESISVQSVVKTNTTLPPFNKIKNPFRPKPPTKSYYFKNTGPVFNKPFPPMLPPPLLFKPPPFPSLPQLPMLPPFSPILPIPPIPPISPLPQMLPGSSLANFFGISKPHIHGKPRKTSDSGTSDDEHPIHHLLKVDDMSNPSQTRVPGKAISPMSSYNQHQQGSIYYGPQAEIEDGPSANVEVNYGNKPFSSNDYDYGNKPFKNADDEYENKRPFTKYDAEFPPDDSSEKLESNILTAEHSLQDQLYPARKTIPVYGKIKMQTSKHHHFGGLHSSPQHKTLTGPIGDFPSYAHLRSWNSEETSAFVPPEKPKYHVEGKRYRSSEKPKRNHYSR